MAKKIFLRDENNVKILPITRGELILDSSGNPAFHSNEFLATDSQPGLMSPDDKQKLEIVAGNTVDTELSNTSTNPVQNKVLTQIINSIREKYLKSAVVSGNKITLIDQSDNTVEFVNSTYQIVTNAVDGLVPKYDAVDGTIDAQTTDWVLTNHNGTLGWYKLPTTAFSSSYVQLFVGAKSTSNNNNSNSATTNGNTYLKLFDNSTLKNQYNIKGTGLATVISDDSGTIVINVPTSHNQASSDINSLTGYSKATAVAAITASDSLNTALGKLELKADTAYNLVKGAYDGDGTIENLAEILKVLEGISDTDTIQAIIGKYLPLAGGTMTGNVTWKAGTGSASCFPAHMYRNTYDNDGNVYDHYYKSDTSSTNSFANLRVKSGTSFKLLRFGGDGTFTWDNKSVSLAGHTHTKAQITDFAHSHDYLPLTGGIMTGALDLTNSPNSSDGYKMGATNAGHLGGGIHFKKNGANDWGQAITWSHSDETSHAGIYVKSSGAYGTKMYLCTTNLFVDGAKAALEIDASGKITALRNNFVGNLTGKASTADSATIAGDGTMTIVPQYNNEINFGGTNASSTLFFGHRAAGSKPIPTAFVFGGSSGSASITASKFIKSGGTSSQFLKADGSVDSNTYVTGGPYLPLSGGTITNNTNVPLGITSSTNYSAIRFSSKDHLRIFGIKEDGELFVTDDGNWNREYVIYHSGNLTKVSQLNNDKGYLTALPSHNHDYIPFEQSVNGKDMDTIKTTGFYYGYTMTNSAYTAISSFIVAKYSPDWGSQIQLCSSNQRAYVRYWQNAGGVMGDWYTLAYTSDIPTKTSQLTNDSGFLTSHQSLANYVTLNTAQTITGEKTFATNILTISNPNNGDATLKFYRGSNTAWTIVDTGGNLKFNELTSNTTRLILYETSQGGSAAFAGTISATGFYKTSSSNDYVLLGAGGHKAISDFMLKSDELTNNLTTITKTLTVTKDWMDTGIKYTDLTTGTYAVQVYVHSSGDGIWYGTWSGIMTWYGSSTNGSRSDEILLHCAGHALGPHIYLRTSESLNSAGTGLRLQIAASKNLTSATYTFKFKKLI